MREPKTIRTLVGTIKGEAKGGGKQEISCYREMINPTRRGIARRSAGSCAVVEVSAT